MKQNKGTSIDLRNPMNYELTIDQWTFMYTHYPHHCSQPYDLMDWLHTQALTSEKKQIPALSNNSYPVPSVSQLPTTNDTGLTATTATRVYPGSTLIPSSTPQAQTTFNNLLLGDYSNDEEHFQ